MSFKCTILYNRNKQLTEETSYKDFLQSFNKNIYTIKIMHLSISDLEKKFYSIYVLKMLQKLK